MYISAHVCLCLCSCCVNTDLFKNKIFEAVMAESGNDTTFKVKMLSKFFFAWTFILILLLMNGFHFWWFSESFWFLKLAHITRDAHLGRRWRATRRGARRGDWGCTRLDATGELEAALATGKSWQNAEFIHLDGVLLNRVFNWLNKKTHRQSNAANNL